MATDFTIKQNDQLPELVATLMDATGTVVDLTGIVGVRFILSVKGGANVLDKPASVVDAVAGIVKYTWEDPDTASAGNFNGEFEVEFGDGRCETFPNSKYIGIKVFADLGGVSPV